MVTLRSFGTRRDDADRRHPVSPSDPADWLPLQQAACELNVSVSTVRRRIRKGELRNRIVPRRGGFFYLVYLPGNRHARGLAHDAQGRPADLDAYRERSDGARSNDEVNRLREQVETLSEALARALRIRQKALPPGMGSPDENPQDPYARYRWLVRRRWWWPF
jgi:hypothetical protein